MEKKPRSVWKIVGLAVLFLALLVLPVLARASYYYRGWYRPGEVNRPDLAAVGIPTVAKAAFQDVDVAQSQGCVVIDYAHENTVTEVELNVLLARLTARGLENVTLAQGDDLASRLRDALALVVVSPHQAFSPDEVEAVQRFVEQGGRVVLLADPGRYGWETKYDETWGEYQVAESDVAALNSLASPFGLAFSDDYIYNTARNAGHYQYVTLADFVDHPLTAGLNQVIFYSAHSLASTGDVVIRADDQTTSSLSEQVGGLAVMGLGGASRVLAVTDFTFMTEPYNQVADNDRLIANIADFIGGASLVYTLADFPRFFGDEVAVVPLVDRQDPQAIPGEALSQFAKIKAVFEDTGRTLQLWGDKPGMDVIYVGLYESVEFWPDVSEILAGRGITFTLQTVERKRATPTPTPRLTPTLTPTPKVSPTATPTQAPLRDWIMFRGAAPVAAQETALFFQNEEGGRQVMIVLAWDKQGLREAAKRLANADFSGCLSDQDRKRDPDVISIALCPVARESIPGIKPTDSVPDLTPTSAAGGGVLIVSDDDGEGMYEEMTEAYDFEGYAQEAGYSTTIWSTSLDGDVTLELVQSFDAVIWCMGDYQEADGNPEAADLDILSSYLDGGGRLILAGAFIGSATEKESGLLLDIQVAQADHLLANGFQDQEVIVLERYTADEDYAPFVVGGSSGESVVFARGPASESAGAAVVTAHLGSVSGRLLQIAFPIYLMPFDAKDKFTRNAISWLMEDL